MERTTPRVGGSSFSNAGELEPDVALAVVDIVSSEYWLRQLGDDRYAYWLDRVKDKLLDVVARHHGLRPVDTGDGAIMGFPRVDLAVAAVLELRRAVAELSGTERWELRFGVHVGPVTKSRHGLVGAAMYEAVELGNAAPADHLWLSGKAAGQSSNVTGALRSVVLPRSGRTDVHEIDLGSGSHAEASSTRAQLPVTVS